MPKCRVLFQQKWRDMDLPAGTTTVGLVGILSDGAEGADGMDVVLLMEPKPHVLTMGAMLEDGDVLAVLPKEAPTK